MSDTKVKISDLKKAFTAYDTCLKAEQEAKEATSQAVKAIHDMIGSKQIERGGQAVQAIKRTDKDKESGEVVSTRYFLRAVGNTERIKL